MDPTRQPWTAAALVVTLAGVAPLSGSVVPAVGAAALAAWLIAVQLVAVRSLRSTAARATVVVEVDDTPTEAGTPIPVTATVERPDAAANTALTVTYPTPSVAEPIPQADRRIGLAPSETRASTTFDVRIPVAGQFRLSEPRWLLADPSGSVTESYRYGPTPEFHVIEATTQQPRVDRNGSESGFDVDGANQHTRAGIAVDRLRPYEQTDSASRIDWNTTARVGEPYVRETATQRSPTVQLVVDHRSKMRFGPPGETMFELGRDVALGVVKTAQTDGNRLGLLTVGDDGMTNTVDPTDRSDGYAELRRRLHELEPTPGEQPASGIEVDHAEFPRALVDDRQPTDSEFGRILQEFDTASTTGASETERRPLVRAMQYNKSTVRASQSCVIITDDTDRTELWAAVRVALQQSTRVVVYLTPSVCFDPEQPPDTAHATDRYRQFEQFRKRVDGLDSVTAFTVGPGSRLAAVRSSRPAGIGELTLDHTQPASTDESTPWPPAAAAAASDGGAHD